MISGPTPMATSHSAGNGDNSPDRAPPHDEVDVLVRDLYADLRTMAAAHLRGERPNHTLQPTALVNEAYLRLAKQHVAIGDRAEFIALASGMMRRILVDHARGKHAEKRGGGQTQVTLLDVEASSTNEQVDLLMLDSAMHRLAAIAPEQARIVELRFFGGLNVDETAAVMNIGRRSVTREWACTRHGCFENSAERAVYDRPGRH